MKKLFKRMTFLTVIILLFSIMCITSQAKPNYKKIYGRLLNTSSFSSSCGDEQPSYFQMIDIDRNGVKELIVTNDWKNTWEIYTIKNGKARRIYSMTFGNAPQELYYNKSAKSLVTYWSCGTGLKHYSFLRMQKGRIYKTRYLRSGHVYKNGSHIFTWWYQGKKCSKAKVEILYNKYYRIINSKGVYKIINTKLYQWITNNPELFTEQQQQLLKSA